MTPNTVTDSLRALAAEQSDAPVSGRQRGLVAGMLEALFTDHAETRRRCLLLAAFDVDSVTDLTPTQVRAVLAWLSPTRDERGRIVPALSADDRAALGRGCG